MAVTGQFSEAFEYAVSGGDDGVAFHVECCGDVVVAVAVGHKLEVYALALGEE